MYPNEDDHCYHRGVSIHRHRRCLSAFAAERDWRVSISLAANEVVLYANIIIGIGHNINVTPRRRRRSGGEETARQGQRVLLQPVQEGTDEEENEEARGAKNEHRRSEIARGRARQQTR